MPGHLVDDAGLIRGQRVQVREVARRRRVQRPGIQLGDASDRRYGVTAAAEGRKDLRERDPLAGAVDLRMRGKNLLAQRGAGAWHADDEHRRRIGVAGARTGCEAGAVEERSY